MPRINLPNKSKSISAMPQISATLLTVDDVKVHFSIRLDQGLFGKTVPLNVVDGVSSDLRKGEALGFVGEIGCNKSTLARAVLQLIPPTFGSVP